MPFYDNYFARSNNISAIGMKIIHREVNNRIRLVTDMVGKDIVKVLELGPGKGHFARASLKLGWDYFAVDGSPAVLKKLGDEGIRVVNAFVPPLPETVGNGYDFVLLEHFIEHMDSPITARALVESIHSVLSKGGLICIVSPDYLAHRSNFWDCDYTHAFVTTNQRLVQLLQDCSFEVCHKGYETLGIENGFMTWLISELTHLLFMVQLPQIVSWLLKGSSELSNKWRNVLLRSCVVAGRKL